MQQSSRWVAAAGSLLVLVATVPPLAASQVTDPTTDQVATGEFNGIEPAEVATLWSRDVESGAATQHKIYRDLLAWADAERSDVEGEVSEAAWAAFSDDEQRALTAMAVGLNGEFSYATPPEHAREWTRGAAEDLDAFGYGEDSSVHPPHADLQSDRYVKDAHATIFAVTPSTYDHRPVHENRSDVPLYVPPSGNVTALVDYRINEPGDWSLTDSEIQNVRLLADGGLEDTTANEHRTTLSFSGLSGDDPVTLRVEAEVTATFARTETDTEEREVTRTIEETETICPDYTPRYAPDCYEIERTKEVTFTEEVKTEETVTEDRSTTVSDEITVRPYDLDAGDVDGWIAQRPDGETLVRVGVEDVPWAGYTIERPEGDDRVQTNVRFYAARNESWDQIQVSTDDGSETYDSPARPVWVHAYRASAGTEAVAPPLGPDASADPSAVERDPPTDVRAWGPTRAANFSQDHAIGEAVAVRYAIRNQTEADVLGARHAVRPDGEVRVRGLVSGETVAVDAEDFTERPVERVRFEVDHETSDRNRTTVDVTLRDEDGDALELGGPDADDPQGRLVVSNANESVIRSAGGTATATVAGRGTYGVAYEPAGWQSADPRDGWSGTVYVANETAGSAGGLGGDRLPALLEAAVLVALPFALVYYTGDRFARLFEFNR